MTDLQVALQHIPPHFHSNCCQHAEGEFRAHVLPGTPHCGLDDSSGHFKYEVLLEFHGEPLDDNGFLLDNTAFQGYFDSLPAIGISCEELADQACLAFVSLLGDRAAYLKDCTVKIYPFIDIPAQADTFVEAETVADFSS
jgi:hypothetical protein